MGISWNHISWNENNSPEGKADEFDRQYKENLEAAQGKRERGEIPYDIEPKPKPQRG